MQRFHVNVAVKDIEESARFYETLFGEAPTVRKPDYAKWMLDDPRINFSLSESTAANGIDHVGLQADTTEELAVIQARLARAGERTFDQPDAECCYAKSSKTWVRDPDAVAWETFVTFGQIEQYGNDRVPADEADSCCKGEDEGAKRCCALEI